MGYCGIGALNPQENMRPVILSLTLMVVGMQAITGALALAVLKLGEERNFKGPSNAALPASKFLESHRAYMQTSCTLTGRISDS